MAPYEVLYGCKCHTHLCWTELEVNKVLGSYLVQKTENIVKLIQGRLSPGFIRPYRVHKRNGPVAYQLKLPSELDHIHDVFHVSMLRGYCSNPTHVVPINEVERLRRKQIPLVKVLWQNHGVSEAIWEPEESMCHHYPHLFGPVYVTMS
ncbi:reverse transcriptase [Gossypium australe]|uniref:Reverse transcriptase n=1 Tax=Gossypium australe TaxID=47621 RepID=A0A5B6WUF2_9ROSI|nr:reverse transcriptase [Gossypium australe]